MPLFKLSNGHLLKAACGHLSKTCDCCSSSSSSELLSSSSSLSSFSSFSSESSTSSSFSSISSQSSSSSIDSSSSSSIDSSSSSSIDSSSSSSIDSSSSSSSSSLGFSESSSSSSIDSSSSSSESSSSSIDSSSSSSSSAGFSSSSSSIDSSSSSSIDSSSSSTSLSSSSSSIDSSSSSSSSSQGFSSSSSLSSSSSIDSSSSSSSSLGFSESSSSSSIDSSSSSSSEGFSSSSSSSEGFSSSSSSSQGFSSSSSSSSGGLSSSSSSSSSEGYSESSESSSSSSEGYSLSSLSSQSSSSSSEGFSSSSSSSSSSEGFSSSSSSSSSSEGYSNSSSSSSSSEGFSSSSSSSSSSEGYSNSSESSSSSSSENYSISSESSSSSSSSSSQNYSESSSSSLGFSSSSSSSEGYSESSSFSSPSSQSSSSSSSSGILYYFLNPCFTPPISACYFVAVDDVPGFYPGDTIRLDGLCYYIVYATYDTNCIDTTYILTPTLINGPFANCAVCEGLSSSSSSSSSFGFSSSSSSSSSSGCELCCGCDCHKLAVNIDSTPSATDISPVDNLYRSTTGGGTGLSNAQAYVGGGSHFNGGGNEYAYFQPRASQSPGAGGTYPDPDKDCSEATGISDTNGCFNIEDSDFDIRLAILLDSNNITQSATLISKWDAPGNAGRGWSLDFGQGWVSSNALSFAWSVNGTDYSYIEAQFGTSGNPTPTNGWVEVRVARASGTIALFWNGALLTITDSDFTNGGPGSTFYGNNLVMTIGNNFESVNSPFSAGFSGYMDYFYFSLCTTSLTSYDPTVEPFSLPNYINIINVSSSSSSVDILSESSSSSSSVDILSESSSSSSSSSSEAYSESSYSESSSSSSSEAYSESSYSESSSSSSSEAYSESSSSESSSSSQGFSSSSSSSSSEGVSSSSSSSQEFSSSSSSSSSSEGDESSSSSSSSSSEGGGYDNTKSFYSDGSNDYIRTDSGFTSWGNQVTVSFFMKWVASNQSKAFFKGNNGGNSWLYCRPDAGGTIRLIIYRPSDIAIQTSGTNYADNTWHHVLFRVNTSTGDAQIIVDNVVKASSTTVTGTLSDPSSYIQFCEVNSYYDEIIVTNSYDDPTDFADFSGATPCPIEPLVSTYIHYRADDVTALTTIPDSSGNSRDGEFFNSTLGSAITTDVPC